MKIVLCSSEVVPFVKTGGLGDVCGALPLALEKLGAQVTVVLPRYRSINKKTFGLKFLNSQVSTVKIGRDIQVLFIESGKYFDRPGLYGDKKGDYPDNLDRFLFFSRKTLEVLKQLNLRTDILHCHDWQSALIPSFLRWQLSRDEFFQKTKSVLTIHNLAFQGIFPKEEFSKLGFDSLFYQLEGFEFHGKINLLKGAIISSHTVTTVSPQYAKEVQEPELGCGLDGILRTRKDGIHGILNGLDYEIWDPVHDPLVATNYSAKNLEDKVQNKRALQKEWGLEVNEQIPLVGFVGRLSHQKGIDLILDTAKEWSKRSFQLAIIGAGDNGYESQLRKLAAKFPARILVHTDFNEKLAHMVYAGSDLFLMPSVFEPCGLSQMIALRYGSIPIVFKTGGLTDTVKPHARGGNGVVFDEYTPAAFLKALDEALAVYADRKQYSILQNRALNSHFSWEDSAQQYLQLFEQCLSGPPAAC